MPAPVQSTRATPRRPLRAPLRMATVCVAAVSLAVTGVLVWVAWSANARANTSLLDLETRQVAATLNAALPSVQSQLDDALNVAMATRSPTIFESFVESQRSKRHDPYVSESLWVRTASGYRLLADVGSHPQLVRDHGATAFFRSLRSGTALSVSHILRGSPRRIGYAVTSPGPRGFVVYAESLLPATRLQVPASSPFGSLNYAVYLGRDERAADLIESSVAAPVTTAHATAAVALGDTFLTVVATPRQQLASATSAALPWIVLGVGVALAIASAGVVEYLGRRRGSAEELSRRLEVLYSEQRTIAATLQHALLPEHLPAIDRVDIAARYLAGAEDVDIGGDWYDVVSVGSDRFVFVIGDVSGRGIRAAAVMASLRFASRGFAIEGHGPGAVIEQLAATLDFGTDGHFATVLCGLADLSRHELTLATAGHPPPLLKTTGPPRALSLAPAPPIGVLDAGVSVGSLTLRTQPGSMLLAYTDGLVERRGEPLDLAIKRLATAADRPAESTDELLDNVLAELGMDTLHDDAAAIGIRWLT